LWIPGGWDLHGNALIGGRNIGNPGSGWSFAGIADIFGDHPSERRKRPTNGRNPAIESAVTDI
jgi:hypothetical protein